ncbi:MAG: alpha-amylase, partial [Gammaproteobacteria bacterium]|nr:alpha-amylase [Gammaproteobacteria bacterium]
CHDDIGLGFDDSDIRAVGYSPAEHRKFLLDYYTGNFSDSDARGFPFGQNQKTGDARISGSLASLVGLETALESNDPARINNAIQHILLLHSLILSFGGIPLLYYGDEIGTLNDCDFLNDEHKAHDSRWTHRPNFNWDKAERRHQPDSIEYKIFNTIKKMIAVRKEIAAFADFNNRELIQIENPYLFVFSRFNLTMVTGGVLVVANFDARPQYLDLNNPHIKAALSYGHIKDLISGESPTMFKEQLVIPPYHFYWLTDQQRSS